MKNKTVIILGSSRSNGNTRLVIDYLMSKKGDIDLIDLRDYNIGYFDYEFKNTNDDFFELIKEVVEYDTIVFATPIYWYAMSAQLKTFFDRMSDLLFEGRKEIGRKLRGKSMASLSCGSDDKVIQGFEMPFKESANYLGMDYKAHVHTSVEANSLVSKKSQKDLKLFLEAL